MNRPPQTFSPPNLFQLGIGTVVIVRYKSGGRVEAGVFLLDVFCLGVKNAFFNQLHEDSGKKTWPTSLRLRRADAGRIPK
jgi:hypothetical protein